MAPNNSFKPKLLRSGKNMAEKACHVFTSTTQFGLTQALGPMIKRLGASLLCALIALAASSVVMAVAYILTSPQLIANQSRLWLLVWAYFPRFSGVPVVCLIVSTLLWRPLPLWAAAAVGGVWATAIFAWWGYEPFLQGLNISWVPFWQHFAGMFTAGLTLGLVFAALSRKWLGPNNSFKPTPLRGAA